MKHASMLVLSLALLLASGGSIIAQSTATQRGVWQCDQIAYQLAVFDSVFQNGTCGYPGYYGIGWNCSVDGGVLGRSGDTLKLKLRYAQSVSRYAEGQGFVAINDQYGWALNVGPDLHVWYYERGNGPYIYRKIAEIPRVLPLRIDTVALMAWHDTMFVSVHDTIFSTVTVRDTVGTALMGVMDPSKTYEFYSGSLKDSTLQHRIKHEGFVPLYLGTRSASTGAITVRGFKVKP
jgi:hypothetical protein